VRRQLARMPLPPVAFPLESGSACLLAAKHLSDVGSLSGRAGRPYPIHYRPALASSDIPSRISMGLPCGRLTWTMTATTGTTLASEEGREDRVPWVPERSWPAQDGITMHRGGKIGRSHRQAKIRGFHVPPQKCARG
jgi:hypothetical protein